MKINKINFTILHRIGSNSGEAKYQERFSCDFTVDGESLLNMILKGFGGHYDFMGCFVRGWSRLNEFSKKQLLLISPPETNSGRCLLYVCPECADIGCGAFGCKISKESDYFIWRDFAYENDYEEPDLISDVGPFKFNAKEYKEIIERVNAL